MTHCARNALQIKTVKVYGPSYAPRAVMGTRCLFEWTRDRADEACENGSATRISKYTIRLKRLVDAPVAADFRGFSCQMGPIVMEWVLGELLDEGEGRRDEAMEFIEMFHGILDGKPGAV